jgi:hypothetical protein
MKTSKRVLLVILSLIAFAALTALPFGLKILREEGWEGVWKRKKDAAKAIIPGSEKSLDKADQAFRKATSDASGAK